MFSPWCCCAATHAVVPAAIRTSFCAPPALRRRRKELRVYINAVRVLMPRGALSRLVKVLQHPHPLVLEQHAVVAGVAHDRVQVHVHFHDAIVLRHCAPHQGLTAAET